MAWKKGPLPPSTFQWGAVVVNEPGVANEEDRGFQFADFKGDHALLVPGGKRVEANDVLFYDNSITMPVAAE